LHWLFEKRWWNQKIGINSLSIKQTGIPTLNTSHPLAQGLVFYGFDTGVTQPVGADQTSWASGGATAGTSYVDLVTNKVLWGASKSGVAAQAPFSTPIASTPYGTAAQFPGHAVNQQNEANFAVTSVPFGAPNEAIRTASFLAWSPSGTGNTFACTAYLTGVCVDGSLIFGRPSHDGSEAVPPQPLHNWDFYLLADGTLHAYVLDGQGGSVLNVRDIGGGIAYTPNTLVSLVCTTKNTTSGSYFGSEASATSTFYVNGAQVGSPYTNIGMYSTTDNGSAPYWFGFGGSGLQDNEDQIQFGSTWHIGAPGNNFFGTNGSVYQGLFWNRALTPTEVQQFWLDPYCMLRATPPGQPLGLLLALLR
jgi:hypothetical protein